MTRLVITEKERMALNIAGALGSYSERPLGGSGRRRVNTYEVSAAEGGGQFVILPLRGHIMNYVTRRELDRWTHDSADRILNDPKSLVKVVSSGGYYSAIRNLAERSSEVIIATDSDDEGELVVDRQPRFDHIGSSTPKLIIMKLSKKSKKEAVRALYDEVLSSLEGEGGAPVQAPIAFPWATEGEVA